MIKTMLVSEEELNYYMDEGARYYEFDFDGSVYCWTREKAEYRLLEAKARHSILSKILESGKKFNITRILTEEVDDLVFPKNFPFTEDVQYLLKIHNPKFSHQRLSSVLFDDFYVFDGEKYPTGKTFFRELVERLEDEISLLKTVVKIMWMNGVRHVTIVQSYDED